MTASTLVVALGLFLQLTFGDTEQDLREAIYQEVALGRTEAAIEAYQALLTEEDVPPTLQARTLHRIAVCLAKLGRFEEAEEALRSLRERFPDQGEIHERAADEVRRYTSAPPARFGRPEIERLILTLGTATGDKLEEAARMLVVLAPESIPHLQEALEHPDATLRLRAAEVLWRLGDDSGFPALMHELGSRSLGMTLVWSAGLSTLRQMAEKDPEHMETILGTLESTDDPRVQAALIDFFRLSGIRTDRVEKRVRELSVDSESAVRRRALAFLVDTAPLEVGLETALQWLEEGADDAAALLDPWMGRARGQEPFPSEMAARLLLQALAHPDPAVQRAAIGYAGKRGSFSHGKSWDLLLRPDQVVTILERAVTLDHPRVREQTMDLVREFQRQPLDDDTWERLGDRLKAVYLRMHESEDPRLEDAGRGGLFTLAGEDAALRRELLPEAIRNLQMSGGAFGRRFQVKTQVVGAVAKEDPDLVVATLGSLLKDDPDASPYFLLDGIMEYAGTARQDLLSAFLDRWPDWRLRVAESLSRRGDPESIPLLRSLLAEGDRKSRLRALALLKGQGDIDTVPDIIPLLDERDEGIREAARAALQEIRRLDEEKDEWLSWYEERKAAKEKE